MPKRENYANQDTATPSSNKKKTANKNSENNSTYSNILATSAGTNFTKEDGQSLFTSLTESFMEEMKKSNRPTE
jgi:hypothetical protein